MLKELLNLQAHSSSASPGTHVWLLQALFSTLPEVSWRVCKLKSTLQSRSCYFSHISTWETQDDHMLWSPAPPDPPTEEIQGCKATALPGTQASALMLQHKGTFIHQFGFSDPKVIPHLKPRPLTVDLSAVMLRLYQHPCHLLPKTHLPAGSCICRDVLVSMGCVYLLLLASMRENNKIQV